MFCSECGKQVTDDAKFCGECGTEQADSIDGLNRLKQAELPSSQNTHQINVNKKNSVKIFIFIFGAILFGLYLLKRGNVPQLLDKEQAALKEFKKSSGQELDQCVGANGATDWSIFKTKDSKENVRVIEAKMKKGEKNFTVQYLYNLDTKVFEISYMSNNDKPKSKLIGVVELGIFCM